MTKRLFLMMTLGMWAQDVTVTGVVMAQDEPDPVIGANVMIKGSTVGTITDFDGNFELQAKTGDVLQVSFMGYKTQELKVLGNGPVRITLEPDNVQLQEVVAIGYGTMKKSDLTGAVTSVSAEQLLKAPVAGLDQALQGRAAGVTVTTGSGQPGEAATIRIRGIGSAMGGNDPLYVVDGVITSDIKFLSPSDIKSMEILKDASATAIYGSRGANGVILITTKSGGEGKANISFDAYWGFQNRWKKLDLMSSSDMADYKLRIGMMGAAAAEAARNYALYQKSGLNAYLYQKNQSAAEFYPTNFDYASQNTDWQDAVFKPNAFMHNYNLSIDGGGDKGHYAFSAGYFSQQGTIIGSNYERLTLRLNSDYAVRKWLTIGEHISFMASRGRNAMNNSSSAGASIISAALAMAPWDPTHYPEGTVNFNGEDISNKPANSSNFRNVTNPFVMVETSHPEDKAERIVGDLYLQIQPVEGLTIKSSISTDFSIARHKLFKDEYTFTPFQPNRINFLESSITRYNTLLEETTITYAREIGKHNFSVMVGQTWSESQSYGIGNSGAGILNPVESNWYLSNTTENNTNPAGDSKSRLRRISFLGRAYYAYDSRYMVTVNFRADASSRFPNNPWGYFPSAAVAWRLSQEPFIRDKDLTWLDNIKIRAGFGQVGNDGVNNSDFITTMESGSAVFWGYPFGPTTPPATDPTQEQPQDQQMSYGAAVMKQANTSGRWETNQQWDAGLDFSFWNGMLSGTIDWFLRDTKDALLYVNSPAHVGSFWSIVKNVGNIRNQGLEITLNHEHRVGPVTYNIGGNLSWIKNELTALNGGSPLYENGTLLKTDVGLPLRTFWGYEYEGVYQSDEEAAYFTNVSLHAGDAIYKDQNGDHILDDKDYVNIGNPFPKLTYGINIGAEFYGVDIQLFFQGVYGNKIYNALRIRTEGIGDNCTLSSAMKDAWIGYSTDIQKTMIKNGVEGDPTQYENRSGTIPNPAGSTTNFANSSRFIEDGSYLRLKNIQIGYTLPKKITQKFYCDRLRFYATASNLFTITKYSGFDPEVGGGVDYGNYPQSRTFTFGLNANF